MGEEKNFERWSQNPVALKMEFQSRLLCIKHKLISMVVFSFMVTETNIWNNILEYFSKNYYSALLKD